MATYSLRPYVTHGEGRCGAAEEPPPLPGTTHVAGMHALQWPRGTRAVGTAVGGRAPLPAAGAAFTPTPGGLKEAHPTLERRT